VSDWGASASARLGADLRGAGEDIGDTREPDTAAARLLATEAKHRARKVTGYMADHIIVAGPGQVEAAAEYAPIIHEGWRDITPNPFMTQAAEHAEWATPYLEHVDHQLDHNLRRSY
jgi:hypothetical protein